MKYHVTKLMMSRARSFIESLRRYSFEIDTYFVPLAYIEDAVDDGIHAGVGAREEEKSFLNA